MYAGIVLDTLLELGLELLQIMDQGLESSQKGQLLNKWMLLQKAPQELLVELMGSELVQKDPNRWVTRR